MFGYLRVLWLWNSPFLQCASVICWACCHLGGSQGDDSPWEGTRLDHDLSQLWVLVVEHCPDCRWLILYHWILLIMPMIAYKSDALSFCRVKKTVACQSYQSRPGLITSMPRVASKGHQHTPALCKDTVSYHPRRPGTGHGTKNESLGDIIPPIYIYIIYIYIIIFIYSTAPVLGLK